MTAETIDTSKMAVIQSLVGKPASLELSHSKGADISQIVPTIGSQLHADAKVHTQRHQESDIDAEAARTMLARERTDVFEKISVGKRGATVLPTSCLDEDPPRTLLYRPLLSPPHPALSNNRQEQSFTATVTNSQKHRGIVKPQNM
jgi:hypothetical protein